jgi:hypothetical protein
MITIELTVYLGRSKYWYKNRKFHRDNDLPAIYSDTSRAWYQEGELHRDNDQPAVIHSNGVKTWYQNGRYIKREE